jgi:hypothetical protein
MRTALSPPGARHGLPPSSGWRVSRYTAPLARWQVLGSTCVSASAVVPYHELWGPWSDHLVTAPNLE